MHCEAPRGLVVVCHSTDLSTAVFMVIRSTVHTGQLVQPEERRRAVVDEFERAAELEAFLASGVPFRVKFELSEVAFIRHQDTFVEWIWANVVLRW